MNKIRTIKYVLGGLIIILIFTYYDYSRSIYKIGNQYLTLWKKLNNKYYIIPYKYYGIMPPENDFILMESSPEFPCLIFIDSNNKKLYFCSDGKYKIVNNNRQYTKYEILKGNYTYESVQGNPLSLAFVMDGRVPKSDKKDQNGRLINKESLLKYVIDLHIESVRDCQKFNYEYIDKE